MTTDISHFGCTDFSILYQGRITGDETAERIRSYNGKRNLSVDPDVS